MTFLAIYFHLFTGMSPEIWWSRTAVEAQKWYWQRKLSTPRCGIIQNEDGLFVHSETGAFCGVNEKASSRQGGRAREQQQS